MYCKRRINLLDSVNVQSVLTSRQDVHTVSYVDLLMSNTVAHQDIRVSKLPTFCCVERISIGIHFCKRTKERTRIGRTYMLQYHYYRCTQPAYYHPESERSIWKYVGATVIILNQKQIIRGESDLSTRIITMQEVGCETCHITILHTIQVSTSHNKGGVMIYCKNVLIFMNFFTNFYFELSGYKSCKMLNLLKSELIRNFPHFLQRLIYSLPCTCETTHAF